MQRLRIRYESLALVCIVPNWLLQLKLTHLYSSMYCHWLMALPILQQVLLLLSLLATLLNPHSFFFPEFSWSGSPAQSLLPSYRPVTSLLGNESNRYLQYIKIAPQHINLHSAMRLVTSPQYFMSSFLWVCLVNYPPLRFFPWALSPQKFCLSSTA